MDKAKNIKISLFLHTEEVKSYDKCIKNSISSGSLKEYKVKKSIGIEGRVFVHETISSIPDWKTEVESLLDVSIDIKPNQANKAVVVFKYKERFFSVVYGYGRSMLNESTIVRNFGLRSVVNLIDENKIRSMNLASIEDVIVDTQRQSTQYGGQELFQPDIMKDLLRSISGSPSNETVAKFLTGMDSLTATRQMKIEDIKENIKFYYATYYKEDYKRNGFAWIDNISEQKSPEIKAKLNDKLILEIGTGNYPTIAPNKVIRWDGIEGFKITGVYSRKYQIDIDSEGYFKKLLSKDYKRKLLAMLKRHKLKVKYTRSSIEENIASIYDSLIYETDYGKEKYILCYGSWYSISSDFYSMIEKQVNNIPISTIKFDPCKANESEGVYNGRIAKSSSDYILMDKKLFYPDNGRSGIEVCDVLTKQRQFIHVKKGGSSSKLSHGFAQVAVFSTTFARDLKMRQFINKVANTTIVAKKLPVSDIEVIFAVIDKRCGTASNLSDFIPFFSMVNLSNTIDTLTSLGIKYSFMKIIQE